MPGPSPSETHSPIRCDILIRGGGIAGLWTLHRLRAAGYRCLLIERTALGSGQTIASQGIIHGGIKYALGVGGETSASQAIARMPELWRACLEGSPPDGHPSLSGLQRGHGGVLAQRQYLWTARGVVARLAGLAASKVIRTPVRFIETPERPQWLAGAGRGVDVYSVDEPVLDPASLLHGLAEGVQQCLVLENASGGGLEIEADRTILTAGPGNEDAPQYATTAPPAAVAHGHVTRTQRRPLHMVMARGAGLPLIYGHCIGAGTTPRLTITSQREPGGGGRAVLYIGGGLAEEGVSRSPAEQIAAARAELRACLPWIDFAAGEFATLRIDRAEGLPPGAAAGARPDEPVIHEHGTVLTAWPTKLAFAPLLADRLLELLQRQGVEPSGGDPELPADVPRPPVAKLPWEEEGVQWS